MLADGDSVLPISACRLRVSPERWPFSIREANAIDAAWERQRAANPHYFNGIVHLLRSDTVKLHQAPYGASLNGELWATDFKAFLHWRGAGIAHAAALDCFGSAAIRSADGCLMLGRQRVGLNAGRTYLPGGLIDDRDVGADGSIDIDASIIRELAEETGLDAARLTRVPGYLVIRTGPMVAIGVIFDAAESAMVLRERIRRHIAAEAQPELADMAIIATCGDLDQHDVPRYTRLAVEYVLSGDNRP